MSNFKGVFRVPHLLIFLIPSYFLYWYNFLKYLIAYKSTSLSPKSYLINTVIGEKVYIGGGIHILNSSIGDYTYLAGSEGGGIQSHIAETVIGKYCSIGNNLQVLHNGHRTDYISTYPFYSSTQSSLYKPGTNHDSVIKKTKIGNDVWIGANVIILGGVIVGDGAIIGAGSVVTKDVAPYTIVVGNPAKVIRERFTPKQRESLLKLRWWDKEEDEIRKIYHLLMSDRCDDFFKRQRKPALRGHFLFLRNNLFQ